MNHLKITILCLLSALFLIASCKPEEKTTPPSLKLSQSEVSVPAAGGTVTLDYTLENAVEGSVITVEPVEAVDWVSGIDVAVAGQIILTVAENEEENSRTAEFTVAYPGAEDASFKIVQQPADPEPAPFEITVKDVKTSSITFDIIPLDKEMNYIFFVSPAEYVADFPEDDDLFNDDMVYFEGEGIDLASVALKGDQIDYVKSPVMPATTFTVYAYGIDLTAKTRLTDIVRVDVTSEEIKTVDVDFDVDVEVSGAAVTLSVDPGSYDGWYYANIVEGLDPEQVEDMLTTCYQFYLNDIALYIGMGMDPETILIVSGYQGALTKTYNLEPEKEYTAIVFALDETPQLCSEPYYQVFQTEKVEPSDNIITMTTTDVTAHTATLNITTTNNDSYVWVQTDPVSFEGYTDEEILQMIIDYYPIYNVYTGNRTEKLSGLSADRDYMILAFGYSGGTVTTPLFKHIFSTPEEATSDVAFEVKYDKWYSIEEVAELMPDEYGFYVNGWDCVMPMEVEADFESIDKYYYYMYDRSSLASMSDEDIKMDLMNNYSVTNPATVFIMSYGQEPVIAGFAIDKNGAYTKVWRSRPFTVTEEAASHDAEEFVNWYNGVFGTKAFSHSFPEPNTVRVLVK